MYHLLQGVLAAEPAVGLVALLGVSVVFVGLVSIVAIVWLMNKICDAFAKKPACEAPIAPTVPLTAKEQSIPNRQEILAAVCAAVAEEEGTDISAIRVISFKKL
jgi:Na+-transporting methylmalonyl-CoA/oxaloacetate decarboxylase gamma subunit